MGLVRTMGVVQGSTGRFVEGPAESDYWLGFAVARDQGSLRRMPIFDIISWNL